MPAPSWEQLRVWPALSREEGALAASSGRDHDPQPCCRRGPRRQKWSQSSVVQGSARAEAGTEAARTAPSGTECWEAALPER